MCGGILGFLFFGPRPEGLSPRVWGHLPLACQSRCLKGSIPTCVGASGPDQAGARRAGVYPHVCGGIPSRTLTALFSYGLSPRVWGHREGGEREAIMPRSIPTCVGASGGKIGARRVSRVYPHVCGGIFNCIIVEATLQGLSPRVWGHRSRARCLHHPLGSIPTCVGASASVHPSTCPARVYPHVCGGIGFSRFWPTRRCGLSPRVWGHQACAARLPANPRSIPTCVGASTTHTCTAVRAWVYPHVCGGIPCRPT